MGLGVMDVPAARVAFKCGSIVEKWSLRILLQEVTVMMRPKMSKSTKPYT